MSNNSYQDKLNSVGQKYNGNLSYIQPYRFDSFPTRSNESIDQVNARNMPGSLNLNPINFVSNASNCLTESPEQATGSEGEQNRVAPAKAGKMTGGDTPEGELSMANIKQLFEKGARNVNLIEEGPKKGGSKMEYNHESYKGGTISPICVQNADLNNS